MGFNIAIDGPAGAGKSTIAKRAAKELGFIYVDTGAMYRAIALYLLRNGVDPENEEALSAALDQIKVEIAYQDGQQQILLNKENVTGLIRTEEVSAMASKSSAKAIVRAKLLALQQDLAKAEDVLMDGRDIGTLVLPNAELKIYLTASSDARAQRRYQENLQKGIECTFEEIKADIEERDYRDMHRDVAPLKQAEDAVYLDTSDMNIDEVTRAILDLYESRK